MPEILYVAGNTLYHTIQNNFFMTSPSLHQTNYFVVTLIFFFLTSPTLHAQSLASALRHQDTVTALKIINAGYNLDALNSAGNSVLIDACRYSADSTAALFLLNHGAKADFPTTPKGRTALMVACGYYGGIPVCRVLINHGADVNAVAMNGESALMLAATNAKADLVEYLLRNGADSKLKDKKGKTALDYAKAAYIDDTIKQALKCCEVDKAKTIALLTAAQND
jgi:ankyrin repeat protein